MSDRERLALCEACQRCWMAGLVEKTDAGHDALEKVVQAIIIAMTRVGPEELVQAALAVVRDVEKRILVDITGITSMALWRNGVEQQGQKAV